MNAILRVRSQNFDKDTGIVCTGWQLVRLAESVQEHFGDIDWYAADVSPYLQNGFSKTMSLERIGSTASLIEKTVEVSQFERGVFVAFLSTTTPDNAREEAATDDDVDVDLGNAVIEIRAFDCSFYEVVAPNDFPFQEVFKWLFEKGGISVQTQ